jgi:hypothetical protein
MFYFHYLIRILCEKVACEAKWNRKGAGMRGIYTDALAII